MENEQITLRDELTASFDALEAGATPPVDAPAIEATQTPEQRARDEAGRFAVKTEAAAPVKPVAPQAQKTAVPAPGKQPEPAAVEEVKRPDSWKKDFEPQWNALDPTLKKYIRQRESEYQTGVSTYKAEADNARQLNEAIAPFLPNLQKHGMEPTAWIRNLGTAHERLALGSPQEKVMMGAQLVKDYGIDPQALFQVLSGQVQYQQPQYRQSPPPQDIERIVDQKLTQKEVNNEYQRFMAEVPEKYPHFEAVKETMAGLLRAELAQDYKSAYEAALRHPRHADLFHEMQKQQLGAEAAKAKEKSQAAANSARARNVSVKSSTPSGAMATEKAQGLRDQLSESFDSVMASRV